MRAASYLPIGLALLLAFSFTPATAETLEPASKAALGDGEAMVFKASWKLFSRAGSIAISADTVEQNEAAPKSEAGARRIRVEVASDGLLARLFTYRATGESLFDPATGRMMSSSYKSVSGKRRMERSMSLDFDTGVARYRDALVPKRDADVPLPAGEPLDLITCLVTARRWNLQPGDTRDVVVLADKRFYPIRLRAERRESIEAAYGTFNALLIVPEPIGTPRGVFSKGGGMRIWIEDAPRALPLRIEVSGSSGTVTADLVRYTPPRQAGTDQ